MSVPVLKTGNTVALAYDAGGTVLEAASQKKGSVLHVASQRAILDADIAADDSICYLSSEPGYKSVLYVYNSQQSLIYRWLSAQPVLHALCRGQRVKIRRRGGPRPAGRHV